MVGNDRLLRKGNQLVVCSKADMDEWEVRQTRKTAIYINDEAWCLVGKEFSSKKELRYLLDPWPDIIREIPGRVIRYDEEYVRTRDEAVKKMRLESGIYPVLYIMKPLIGFLPSRVKIKIEEVSGISARNATRISIFIELLLFFSSGALLQISAFGFMYGFHVSEYARKFVSFIPGFIALTLVIFIDLVIRYGSYLREEYSPLGALEWLWSWTRRKKS